MVECEYKFQRKNGANEHSFNRYMVECELTEIVTSCFACSSFNRYMVECESGYVRRDFRNAMVLIDTWWNVNINFSGKMAQMSTVLIDTWWNVN